MLSLIVESVGLTSVWLSDFHTMIYQPLGGSMVVTQLHACVKVSVSGFRVRRPHGGRWLIPWPTQVAEMTLHLP